MPARISTPPKTTVFSTDPTTGKPFMEIAHAQKLAWKHVHLFGNNLPFHYSKEDLVQECLSRICFSNFDPTRASAKTFAILVYTSRLGQLFQHNQNSGRFLEASDFTMFEDDSNQQVYATDVIGQDHSDPECILAAIEVIQERFEKPRRNKARNKSK
jgi:DNA-directed RNA polymerase specialized sigma24 family protein